jgi:hypothetical protein
VHLMGGCLIGVHFTSVYFIRIYFIGVCLMGVYLTGVPFIGVYLMSVHLRGVRLIGVYLRRAPHCVYPTGVYVMGMHLIGMHLIGVYIMGVHHRMQPFYLVVRTYLRLLVVAGLVSHFSRCHSGPPHKTRHKYSRDGLSGLLTNNIYISVPNILKLCYLYTIFSVFCSPSTLS